MAIWFVKTATIVAAPNDANDGRDPIGFGLTTATYNDTTKTVTETGAFSSYTFTAGDLIYISGGTGATPGLYTIASKVDNDNITLTASAGSTDATGDWTSSTGPFATPGAASDALAAGDEVRICNDGTHSLAAAWTWGASSTSGTLASPVQCYGASARGVDDVRGTTTRVILKRTTTTTLLYDNNTANNLDYVWFQNLAFNDSNEGAAILAAHNGIRFIDCTFNANDDFGLQLGNAATIVTLIRCVFSNTVGTTNGDGLGHTASTTGQVYAYDCSFHDNARYGARIGAQAQLNNCVAYDNGNDGFFLEHGGSSRFFQLVNCVSYGNTGDGVFLSTAGPMHIFLRNNIFAGNGGYGINYNNENIAEGIFGPNNCYNNTAGECSLDGSTETAATVIDDHYGTASTADNPNFRSVVDGSENFTPVLQDAKFSEGQAGDCPAGVSAFRATYMGAVPPDLGAGGDGLGGGGYILGG